MLLLVYFVLGIKRIVIKLGGFTYTFDEITDVKSLEKVFDGLETASKQQFTSWFQENQVVFFLFSWFSPCEGKNGLSSGASLLFPVRMVHYHVIID